MGNCIIFCAAEFDGLLSPIPEDALVIAADGGLRHTEALGLRPDVIMLDPPRKGVESSQSDFACRFRAAKFAKAFFHFNSSF